MNLPQGGHFIKRLSQKPEICHFTPSTIYCKGGKWFKIAFLRQPPMNLLSHKSAGGRVEFNPSLRT
jgi:hypothetical protein